jgi:hypothetical protein
MVIKKEIVYPIFLECCELIDDVFWKNVFEDLAYSKCPYGTYITKDFFCCSYKNKEFSYKIEKKDPQVLYDDIYVLLVKKLGLLSNNDKIQKKIAFNNMELDIKETHKCWSSIRKKNIKDSLIANYVIDMKNKFSLSVKQARHLLSIIFIGMVFKVITIKDILYEDGVILNIGGIKFKQNELILERDIYDFKTNMPSFIIIEKKMMSDSWCKYLENLKKLVDLKL